MQKKHFTKLIVHLLLLLLVPVEEAKLNNCSTMIMHMQIHGIGG